MGQKMSSNEDLIHSMKKLRLTNSNTTCSRHDNAIVFKILDPLSPTSPSRKTAGDENNNLRNAAKAVLEEKFTVGNTDENAIQGTIDHIQLFHILRDDAMDTPVLDGASERTSDELCCGDISTFDDSYSDEELISFILHQEESLVHAVGARKSGFSDVCQEAVFENNHMLRLNSVQFAEPSDEEICRYLRSF